MRRFDLLSVQGLRVVYEGAVEAVRDVTVRVAEHEIVTMLGSNGAGKTSIASAVCGVAPYVAGRVRFAGEDLRGARPHEIVARGIVMVPSGRAVFPAMSVRDNLLVGAHAYRGDRARVRRSLDAVYERFPAVAAARSRRAGTLSGGEQQTLSIARGLMARPRLLILDEPSMGLDPAGAAGVVDLVRALREDGVTILLVEKMVRAAMGLSDRLYVLELGAVVAEGPPAALAADPEVERAYLGRRAWEGDDPGRSGA